MFEQDVDVQLRMPWEDLCKIACAAMIRNMTIDEFTEAAIRARLAQGGQ